MVGWRNYAHAFGVIRRRKEPKHVVALSRRNLLRGRALPCEGIAFPCCAACRFVRLKSQSASPPPPSLPPSLRGAAQQSLFPGGTVDHGALFSFVGQTLGWRFRPKAKGPLPGPCILPSPADQRWPSVSVSSWKRPLLSTSQMSRYVTEPIFAGAGNGAAALIMSTAQGATSPAAG
jgi:hypothetical protein